MPVRRFSRSEIEIEKYALNLKCIFYLTFQSNYGNNENAKKKKKTGQRHLNSVRYLFNSFDLAAILPLQPVPGRDNPFFF